MADPRTGQSLGCIFGRPLGQRRRSNNMESSSAHGMPLLPPSQVIARKTNESNIDVAIEKVRSARQVLGINSSFDLEDFRRQTKRGVLRRGSHVTAPTTAVSPLSRAVDVIGERRHRPHLSGGPTKINNSNRSLPGIDGTTLPTENQASKLSGLDRAASSLDDALQHLEAFVSSPQRNPGGTTNNAGMVPASMSADSQDSEPHSPTTRIRIRIINPGCGVVGDSMNDDDRNFEPSSCGESRLGSGAKAVVRKLKSAAHFRPSPRVVEAPLAESVVDLSDMLLGRDDRNSASLPLLACTGTGTGFLCGATESDIFFHRKSNDAEDEASGSSMEENKSRGRKSKVSIQSSPDTLSAKQQRKLEDAIEDVIIERIRSTNPKKFMLRNEPERHMSLMDRLGSKTGRRLLMAKGHDGGQNIMQSTKRILQRAGSGYRIQDDDSSTADTSTGDESAEGGSSYSEEDDTVCSLESSGVGCIAPVRPPLEVPRARRMRSKKRPMIYDRMDMVREMRQGDLYLYRGQSMESQTVQEHMRLFDAGENIRDAFHALADTHRRTLYNIQETVLELTGEDFEETLRELTNVPSRDISAFGCTVLEIVSKKGVQEIELISPHSTSYVPCEPLSSPWAPKQIAQG